MLRPTMTTTAAVTLAAVGSLAASADWQLPATPRDFTVYASTIPRMPAPIGTIRTIPRIAWTTVDIAPGVAVQRYVVTRHIGPTAQVVCDVPALGSLRCVDAHAPVGYRIAYTVAASCGRHWRGPDSEPSAWVTMPGIAAPLAGASVPPSARVGTPRARPSASSRIPSKATPAASIAVHQPEFGTAAPATAGVAQNQSSTGSAVVPTVSTAEPHPSPLVSLPPSIGLG